MAAGSAQSAQSAERYGYDGAAAAALSVYRRGWVEILSYGRWTEAERLYRVAVERDPDFLIAKSVLARITSDPRERLALYNEVERRRDEVGEDGQLILDIYQRTLQMFVAREAGRQLPDGFRARMAADARRNYRAFLDRYPGEWSVLIEFLEWVHAIDGGAGALDTIADLRSRPAYADVDLSYFPASFHAELGDWSAASKAFRAFVAQLPAATLPQPHFACALLASEKGEYGAALAEVERALDLDPRHLLAARLRQEILARGSAQSATKSARSVQTIFSSVICTAP